MSSAPFAWIFLLYHGMMRQATKNAPFGANADKEMTLELCDILCISVNELLSGEKIDMENNNQKNEQLLLDMAKEVEQKDITIWTSMWVIIIISVAAVIAGA